MFGLLIFKSLPQLVESQSEPGFFYLKEAWNFSLHKYDTVT